MEHDYQYGNIWIHRLCSTYKWRMLCLNSDSAKVQKLLLLLLWKGFEILDFKVFLIRHRENIYYLTPFGRNMVSIIANILFKLA